MEPMRQDSGEAIALPQTGKTGAGFDWTAPVILHVGLHKCASTWLQGNLFSRQEHGFLAPLGGMSHMAVTEFVAVDPLQFDPELTRMALLRAQPEWSRAGVVTVVSHEALSSRPHHGRYYAPEVARRLKAVFPGAKVLLIFREQGAMISALHVEHVRNGGLLRLEEFVGTGSEPPGWTPLCQLSFFHYDRLVAFYRDLFGPDNVLALPLEMLRADPDDFTRRILDFAELPWVALPTSRRSNVSWGPAATELMRRFNRVLRRNTLGPEQPPAYRLARRLVQRVNRHLPAGVQRRQSAERRAFLTRRIGDEFCRSNAALEQLVGLALDDYGYRVVRQRGTDAEAGAPGHP